MGERIMVEQIMQRMIEESSGDVRGISHFLKVYGYARQIGLMEGCDPKTQQTVEMAAILHDMACPLCREKYGHAHGWIQEIEGGPMAEAFLEDFDLPQETKDRLVYLVSHHHTFNRVDGLDHQILLEADFLVNADEGHCSTSSIRAMEERVFKTETGKKLLRSMYLS